MADERRGCFWTHGVVIIPPPVGEAGFSSARLRTYVRVYVRVYVTTLQRCGGIRAIQALLFEFYYVLVSLPQRCK